MALPQGKRGRALAWGKEGRGGGSREGELNLEELRSLAMQVCPATGAQGWEGQQTEEAKSQFGIKILKGRQSRIS